MSKTRLLFTWLSLVAIVGEAAAQSEFVSSKESATFMNMGYSGRSHSKALTLSGGLSLSSFAELQMSFAGADFGPGGALVGFGVGGRPFWRVSETDWMSILLGLPIEVGYFTEAEGGRGGPSSISLVSIGISFDLAVMYANRSQLALSLAAARAEASEDIYQGRSGTHVATVGASHCIGISKVASWVVGAGASFAEGVDESSFFVNLGFVFARPR